MSMSSRPGRQREDDQIQNQSRRSPPANVIVDRVLEYLKQGSTQAQSLQPAQLAMLTVEVRKLCQCNLKANISGGDVVDLLAVHKPVLGAVLQELAENNKR